MYEVTPKKSLKLSTFKSIIFLILMTFFTVWVIISGSYYRWLGYERIPTPSLDELTYTWQGLSLRERGIPIAWGLYPGIYMNQAVGFIAGNLSGFGIKTNEGDIGIREYIELGKNQLSHTSKLTIIRLTLL